MRVFSTAVLFSFAVNAIADQSEASEISGMGAHKCNYLTSNWELPGLRVALVDWANGFVSGLSYGANLPDKGFTYKNVEIMALLAMDGCDAEPDSVFVEQFTDILNERLRK